MLSTDFEKPIEKILDEFQHSSGLNCQRLTQADFPTYTSIHTIILSCSQVQSDAEILAGGCNSQPIQITFSTCCFPTLASSYSSLLNSCFPLISDMEPLPLGQKISVSKVWRSMPLSISSTSHFQSGTVVLVRLLADSKLEMIRKMSVKAAQRFGNEGTVRREGGL